MLVYTSQGAVLELWLDGKAEKRRVMEVIQGLMRISGVVGTEGFSLYQSSYSYWAETDTATAGPMRIGDTQSEIIAISPTHVLLYGDKHKSLCQAVTTLHFPTLGHYSVRIRLTGRVSHTLSAPFQVGNRLIIPEEADQILRLPLLKVKVTCWPVHATLPDDEFSHLWRAVEKYPVNMPNSRLFASANLLVVLLRPNWILAECVSNRNQPIGLLSNGADTVQSLRRRTVEAGVEPAKAWLCKGAIMQDCQTAASYSLGPNTHCEQVYGEDALVEVKDLRGNCAILACPHHIRHSELCRKVALVRANWDRAEVFCYQGQVYPAYSELTFEGAELHSVLLLCTGETLGRVRHIATSDIIQVALGCFQRRGKDFKLALAKTRDLPIAQKHVFAGKLRNSFSIRQYGLRNRTELMIVRRPVGKATFAQARVQLGPNSFISLEINANSSFSWLKELVCKRLDIHNSLGTRIYCSSEEAEDQESLNGYGQLENYVNVLFLRPEEWILRAIIEKRPILVPLNSQFTVISVKSAIQKLTGFTAAHMSLYSHESRPEDCKTMEELGLMHKSEVEIRFPAEFEVRILPIRGKMWSLGTSSTVQISTFRQEIAAVQGTFPRLVYRGEELEDSEVVGRYGLMTWAVVTEISSDSLQLLTLTPSGGSFLDLCLHPNTTIRKIKAKIRQILGISQCDFDLIITKELENEEDLKLFLPEWTETQPTLFFR